MLSFRPKLSVLILSIPRISRRCFATRLKDYETHYDVLEVSPEATQTEIRESWLRLSMMYHPDINTDSSEAQDKFIRIREAYKVLINEEKRKEYNDKIGFYHHDPPPDYHREWTLKGEKDRTKAEAYAILWDEDKIRDLLSSEKLRDVDWRNKAPSERYQILMQAERERKEMMGQLAGIETPSIEAFHGTYILIMIIVGCVVTFAVYLERQMEKEEVRSLHREENRSRTLTDIYTPNGGMISKHARVDLGIPYNYMSKPKKEENIEE